ncbi:hypothetical protein DXG03_001119 [Asterophora parasitica]|uniref:B-related factor 1 n=1 Tax=Asterophora parasitica TaxID=117018 RepID=A0A9P7GCN9_9AGAR|nr:hypothetical protein DXG03_001119 [Asterophora parasitica]
MTCNECGGAIAWDDDAGSSICTQCGTLVDPSQTLLTDHVGVNSTSQASGLWNGAASTTLKSFRGQGPNWDLAGQGKEARDRKNAIAMAGFVSSLAVSINAAGLSPRATIIFNQAMAKGMYRWGRKAKLVAGASLAIALREYHRPDSIVDIAYLLDEQCNTLVRTLTSVVSVLDISLAPVDPSIHIPPLLDYLTSVMNKDPLQHQTEPKAQLPAPLLSQLKLVSLRAASHTATSLFNLLTRLGPDHPLNFLPSPPTAVALFLLGLEAESRTPLSQLGDLAQCLGTRCHRTSRGVAMQRYKVIQDEIASWIEQVPWLCKYEQRNICKGKNRAKVGKRSIVARGLPDVLQFQEEIWRGKLKPTVVLDIDVNEREGEDEEDIAPEACTSVKGRSPPADLASRPPPPKRRKIVHHPLRDATQFLLNPLTAPLPTCESPPHRGQLQPPSRARTFVQVQSHAHANEPPPCQMNVQHASSVSSTYQSLSSAEDSQCATTPHPCRPSQTQRQAPAQLLTPTHCQPQSQSKPSTNVPARNSLSLSAYILAAPDITSLHSTAPPTRLQLLTASRIDAGAIEDDDLFGEGELQGYLRDEVEAGEYARRMVGLGIFGDESESEVEREMASKLAAKGEAKAKGNGKEKGKKADAPGEGSPRKSRVNLDALARFLQKDGVVGDGEDDDKGEGSAAYGAVLLGLERFPDKDDEEGGNWLYDTHHHDSSDDEDGEEPACKTRLRMRTPPRTKNNSLPLRGPNDEEEVVLDEWRPLSPDMGFGFAHGGGGAYEEEYD